MSDSRSWRHFDWVLLLTVVLLVGIEAEQIPTLSAACADNGSSRHPNANNFFMVPRFIMVCGSSRRYR